ncbi:MAG: condensation domain-containing protein, partial [Pseudomonadota bacterium]
STTSATSTADLATLFEYPRLKDLAQQLKQQWQGDGAKDAATSRPVPTGRLTAPLSPAQARLWFLQTLDPQSSAYNMPAAFHLKGKLDTNRLQQALNALATKHPALKTKVAREDGKPIAVIDPDAEISLNIVTASADQVQQLMIDAALQPFDLMQDLPLRVGLYQLGEAEWLLLLTLHHIAADGQSVALILDTLTRYYEPPTLIEATRAAPVLSYMDVSLWQAEQPASAQQSQQLKDWADQLAGIPPRLSLPFDRPPTEYRQDNGARIKVSLPKDLADRCRQVAGRYDTTLYTVLLSGLAVCLGRVADEADVVIGTAFSGRTDPGTEAVVGCFVNTLPIRCDLTGAPNTAMVINRLKERLLWALQRQSTPFEQIVEAVDPPRSLAHTPIYQVIFAMQDQSVERFSLAGCTITALDQAQLAAKYDLALSLAETEHGSIEGHLDFPTDLFNPDTIDQLARDFAACLNRMSHDPELALIEVTDPLPRRSAQAVLRDHDQVADVLMTTVTDSAGATRRVAFVQPQSDTPHLNVKLQRYTQQQLPTDQCPEAIILVDESLDANALPTPDATLFTARVEPPATVMEQKIAAVWRDVLSCETVGRDDGFFALGGHSLKANLLVWRLQEIADITLTVRDVFAAPTLRNMAAKAEAAQATAITASPLRRANREEPIPLTPAQLEIYVAALLNRDSSFTIPGGYRLTGHLDPERLEATIQGLIDHHEILRTGFVDTGDGPNQMILPQVSFAIDRAELTHEVDPFAAAKARADQLIAQPFDLKTPPLLRVGVYHFGDDDWALVFSFHHLVFDGWSLNLFMQALWSAYDGAHWSAPTWQYADYAQSKAQSDDTVTTSESRAFWHKTLSPPPEPLILPLNGQRRPDTPASAAWVEQNITGSALERLRLAAAEHNVSLFQFTMAALQTVLARLGQQDEVTLAMVTAGRDLAQTEDMFGLFVNTTIIRQRVNLSASIHEHISASAATISEALGHSDYPLSQLIEELAPPTEPGHMPFADMLVDWHDDQLTGVDPASQARAGFSLRDMQLRAPEAKRDLILYLRDKSDRLELSVEYRTALFDGSTVFGLLSQFEFALGAFAAGAGAGSGSVSCVGDVALDD